MPADFGLALVEKHPKTDDLNQWLKDLDHLLPRLEGHFKSLWMTDHLFWGEQYAYEVWTVLTWLAARWPSFDVGPMVMGQNYRNPALTAKMASTLQVFSGGRFIMGIGAGWKEDEYAGYGYPYPTPGQRLEQLDETIEIVKRLWTQPGKVNYQGKHYQLQDAILEPKPLPVPPICVGVAGNRALALAAKHADWWNLSDAGIDHYKERMAVLDDHCARIGRDPQTIRRTWFGRLVTGRNEAEVQARAVSRVGIVYNRENAFVGTPNQIIADLKEFVAIGCDYFMIDVVGLPNPDIIDIVVNEIIPGVNKG